MIEACVNQIDIIVLQNTCSSSSFVNFNDAKFCTNSKRIHTTQGWDRIGHHTAWQADPDTNCHSVFLLHLQKQKQQKNFTLNFQVKLSDSQETILSLHTASSHWSLPKSILSITSSHLLIAIATPTASNLIQITSTAITTTTAITINTITINTITIKTINQTQVVFAYNAESSKGEFPISIS